MIEVSVSQAVEKTAQSIRRLPELEGYRNLVKAMASELAVKQVEFSEEMLQYTGTESVAATAKSALIRSQELKIALRILDEFVNKPSEEILEVELRVT